MKTEFIFQFENNTYSMENTRTVKQGYLSIKGKELSDKNHLDNYNPQIGEEVTLSRGPY